MELDEEKPKTQVFDVRANNSGDLLGQIKWHSHWRQYCFFSNEIILSKGCMIDINNFIDLVMKYKKLEFDDDGIGHIPTIPSNNEVV